MNSTPKIISISDRMAQVHKQSAERAAERVHQANSILEDAFRLALCDCEDCRTERMQIVLLEAQERRIAQQMKREWLERAAWWAVVIGCIAVSAYAILRVRL